MVRRSLSRVAALSIEPRKSSPNLAEFSGEQLDRICSADANARPSALRVIHSRNSASQENALTFQN